jgi:hypothetical protein
LAQLKFCEIDFGRASAESESAQKPALLTKGFLDLHGVRGKVLVGPEFLFLGYKGSGKSAITEHLRLIADDRSDLFVRRIFLAEFPFTDFGNILRGSQDNKARYPATWSWLLYLQIVNSFAADQGATHNDGADFQRSVELLQRNGLLPTPSLHEIVLKSSQRSFRVALGKVLEVGTQGSRASTGDINFLTFVEILRNTAAATRSESQHLIVIDGLDDILLRDPIQYDVLSALVVEVNRVNAALREAEAPAKIVLLCRSDIYDRLPGPNLNKIRQDAAVELNWFGDPHHPERSELVALANAKAKVSDPKLADVFAGYLPTSISFNQQEVAIHKFLLDRTRHLPRDFLQLLKAIQDTAPQHKGRLTEEMVLTGARTYSQGYFIGELRDEVAGHFTPEERDAGFEALARLRSARFRLSTFQDAVGAQSTLDARRFLSTLFDCGALGTTDGGFFTFRYRNPLVPFDDQAMIVLHRALAPSMNVAPVKAGS